MRFNAASISGGRTSGKMLRDLLDAGVPIHPMFCNTGKERDETLDFVHEIEVRWNVPITWLEYTRVPARSIDPMVYPHPKSQSTVREQQDAGESTHWFRVVNYETARRRTDHWTPFDELLGWANVLPNVRTRMCSVQMKVRTMMRYLFSQGIYEWTDHIGIRFDEQHRALEILANAPQYRHAAFPLVDAKVTEADVFAFWAAQPFDLQLDSIQGNCDLCFLKARHKRVKIARDDPASLIWWEGQEEIFKTKAHGEGRYFRSGEPYAYIRTLAEYPMLPFDEDDIDVPCGCGDKGFVLAEKVNCEL